VKYHSLVIQFAYWYSYTIGETSRIHTNQDSIGQHFLIIFMITFKLRYLIKRLVFSLPIQYHLPTIIIVFVTGHRCDSTYGFLQLPFLTSHFYG